MEINAGYTILSEKKNAVCILVRQQGRRYVADGYCLYILPFDQSLIWSNNMYLFFSSLLKNSTETNTVPSNMEWVAFSIFDGVSCPMLSKRREVHLSSGCGLDETSPHANKGRHQFHEEDKIVVGVMVMFLLLFLLIEWVLYWERANCTLAANHHKKSNQCTSVLGICFKLILIPSMTRLCRDSYIYCDPQKKHNMSPLQDQEADFSNPSISIANNNTNTISISIIIVNRRMVSKSI